MDSSSIQILLTLLVAGVWITAVVIFCDFTLSPHPFKWWWWKDKDKTLMTAFFVSIFLMVAIPIAAVVIF